MFSRRIITYLNKWKNKKERKPLIIRGARQVGKTSAVLIFAKENFQDLIYINLENVEHLRLFKEEISLQEFESIIKIKFNKQIIPGRTLIFLDEIQNSLPLIKLLRFFYEEWPQVHIIACGSLLEARIKREGFSFPVGRVQFAYLYPLDYFEYLEAKNQKQLLEFLKNVKPGEKIPSAIHNLALEEFYKYAMIGGMPEVVKHLVEGGDIRELKSIYSSLFTSYHEDVYKYSSLAEAKYLSYVIETAPLFAGNLIKYKKFGGSNFGSREMSKAFDILEKVMLLYQIQATKSRKIPLLSQPKRPKKLIFLDVGLVNHRMGIQDEFLGLKELDNFYRGRIAEQIVAQNLLAQFIEDLPKIFYWAKEKQKGSAEVDFCLIKGGKILGIEVKAGSIGKLKSLFSFVQEIEDSLIFRIYSGEFKKEKIRIKGKNYRLISLPFYLAPRILEIAGK